MNHLRDLLDTPISMLRRDSAFPPDLALNTARGAYALGERAVSFFLGSAVDVLGLTVIPELCRLPFDTCWFEFSSGLPEMPDGIIALMVTRINAYNHQIIVWNKLKSAWYISAEFQLQDLTSNQIYILPNTDAAANAAAAGRHLVCAALSALHCNNVQQTEHRPPVRLQKARARRGKQPLFSYWTLELSGPKKRGPNLGGTHAGPRVHLRRGHPREYAPGKWTWVQPCAVGNRAAGIAHKDYDGAKLAAKNEGAG